MYIIHTRKCLRSYSYKRNCPNNQKGDNNQRRGWAKDTWIFDIFITLLPSSSGTGQYDLNRSAADTIQAIEECH